MDKKEITITGWQIENGKKVFHVNEIIREITKDIYKKGSLVEQVYPSVSNNKILFPGMYYGEYEDIPDIEYCIEDETRIKNRRKGRGKKR